MSITLVEGQQAVNDARMWAGSGSLSISGIVQWCTVVGPSLDPPGDSLRRHRNGETVETERLRDTPRIAGFSKISDTTAERTASDTRITYFTNCTYYLWKMATLQTTLEGRKGVKHPLILSPRIDTKRYNPTTITHKTSQACAQPLTKAMHKSPQDVCELGCSQDAGAWVPETHTRVRHPPTTRTRHRAHSAHGRLAPTSPPSAGGARGRRRRRIPSVAAADEAPAKVERPHLKGTVSGRKAQVRVLQRSHGSAREARE